MTTLVLVRHGQASFGTHNYDRLSATGIRQSEVLGAHWDKLQTRWDACYSGDMQRQKDTGTLALKTSQPDSSPTANSAFNEYDADEAVRAYLPLVARENPEFTLDKRELFSDRRKFQQFFEKVIHAWVTGQAHSSPSLESWKGFRERVLAGLREIVQPGGKEHVAVFTSGGIITVALQAALKLDDATAFQMNWRINNASQHVFRWGRNGLTVLGFNNMAHLELERDPALLTYR